MKATVFLGGGRITSALVAGLRLAGYQSPIVVHDRNPEKLRALRREFRVEIAADVKSALRRAGMLVIAVRPASVADVLEEITRYGACRRSLLAVSLAAGIPFKRLRAELGPPVRWARAMPSPVCRIGRGLTGLAFDRSFPTRERKRVRDFFAQVGAVLEIPEKCFDAFTATYSSSHGYHALVALAKAGRSAGLDRKTALTAAAHALAEGIRYWKESEQDLSDLLHEAATPGGIAAATMAAMDGAGYQSVVAKGLKAGMERARRNAKLR
jgi:pyrroline-5-carboxylate reductase